MNRWLAIAACLVLSGGVWMGAKAMHRATAQSGTVAPKEVAAAPARLVADADRVCPGTIGPPRGDDPGRTPDLLAHVRAGDWAGVRMDLAMGAAVPAGLTKSQAARVERERLSLGLYQAARLGDVAGVRRAVAAGAEPDVSLAMDDVLSPLAAAARCDQVEAIRALTQAGARVDLPLTYVVGKGEYANSTALAWAAESDAAEAARALIALGADVNAQETVRVHGREGLGRRVLDRAASEKMRRLLREAGAVGAPDSPLRCDESYALGQVLLTPSDRDRFAVAMLGHDKAPLTPEAGCLWSLGEVRGRDGRVYQAVQYLGPIPPAGQWPDARVLLVRQGAYIGYFPDVRLRAENGVLVEDGPDAPTTFEIGRGGPQGDRTARFVAAATS